MNKKSTTDFSQVPSPDDEISVLEATNFIAHQLQVPAGEIRAMKDNIRKQIIYALKNNGKLKFCNEENLRFSELINWGLSIPKWKSALAEFAPLNSGRSYMALPALKVQACGSQLPLSIEDCHRELIEAKRLILDLREENAKIQEELKILRPIAAHDQEKRLKNQKSAKRPRSRR